MDTLLPELTNLGAIVRTLILFVVTFFIGRTLTRYLSQRSVKSITRRINDRESVKLLIDNLAKSDRSILLYAFIGVLEILGLLSFAFAIPPLLSLLQGERDLVNLLFGIVLVLTGVYACHTSSSLQKIDKYPESVENLNKEIDALKARLAKLTE